MRGFEMNKDIRKCLLAIIIFTISIGQNISEAETEVGLVGEYEVTRYVKAYDSGLTLDTNSFSFQFGRAFFAEDAFYGTIVFSDSTTRYYYTLAATYTDNGSSIDLFR